MGRKGISQNSLSSWHLMFLLEMLQKIKSKTEDAYGMNLKASGLVVSSTSNHLVVGLIQASDL